MDIKYLHDCGLLPDIYYYQLNNETPERNYEAQRRKMFQRVYKRMLAPGVADKVNKSIDDAVEQIIEEFLAEWKQ